MIVRMRGSLGIRFLVAPLFAAALVIAGCAPGSKGPSGPVVLEMEGKKVTLEDLRLEYEHVNGDGSFAKATADQKSEFLKTTGDKDVLIAVAEEKAPLTPAQEKAWQSANDQKLLKGLEFKILAPIRADSATSKAMLETFKQQILANWLVTDSDSLTKVAKAEVAAGRPFAEVARKYSKADPTKVKDGEIDWTSAMQFGRDYAAELFLTAREPGYLSEVRSTPRGYELFQVKGYRPYDLSGFGEASFFPQLVKEIRSHDRLTAWSDSLQKARGVQYHDDAIATLSRGMASYWDSLQAEVQKTRTHITDFRPPVSHFSADQLKTPLYQIGGKETTIGEFLGALPGVDPRMWPNTFGGPSGFRAQVNSIALMQLEVALARDLGIDRMPGYLLESRLDREKALLGNLSEMVTKEQPAITEEEKKAYYDAHTQDYTTKDVMLLSYLIFKTKPEAEHFYAEALKHPPDWWAEACGEYQKNPDVRVVSNSPQIDKNNPSPEVKPFVEKARNMKVNDMVGPTETVGGWGVARVAFNQFAGLLPMDKVEPSIERGITDGKVASAMQKLINEGKERYKLKLYPERLAPTS